MKFFMDNRLVPEAKAKVSVLDRSFLYGDGIYETMRVYQGQAFMLEKHLERLFQSADMIFLRMPWSRVYLLNAVERTIRANRLKEGVLRLAVSRGAGPRGLDPKLAKRPTLVIMVFPFKPYPPSYYTKGISIALTSIRRNHRLSLNPVIKSNNFLNNILAWKDAHDRGAQEGVFLNVDGNVAEGTTSNIFLVKNKTVITPAVETGILLGVTRQILLGLSKRLGYKTQERFVKPHELFQADEAFLAGTTIEVLPIHSVDNKVIASGLPGPVTKSLAESYTQFKKTLLG